MREKRDFVLWTEDEWRCEFHSGLAGHGRLEVYCGTRLITAESTLSMSLGTQRGEILRRRVLRGDLRAEPA